MRGFSLDYETYHAGQHEDRHIRERWPRCPSIGTFVDIGAGNGITASNTLHFARNGWTGLLIDADPRQCRLLFRNRPDSHIEHVAVCDHDGAATIYLTGHLDHATLISDLYLNSRIGTVQVPAARLESLLEYHDIGPIDLLSIDVEGAEMAAWRSMDFEKHRPACVVIEHEHSPGGADEMRAEFEGLDYLMIDSNRSNFVFVLRDKL